jgi:dihydroxy-acid dehydratase
MDPAGPYTVKDLDDAGGIPAVLKELGDHIHQDVLTVTGKTLGENVKDASVLNREVVRPKDNPVHKEGGIAILKGTLAPEGAVVKQSAVDPKMLKFEGPAKVFDSEEDALKAIMKQGINLGEVIVIRYEGPKGGPGMKEMLKPTAALMGTGLGSEVALVTDARFSGATRGPSGSYEWRTHSGGKGGGHHFDRHTEPQGRPEDSGRRIAGTTETMETSGAKS